MQTYKRNIATKLTLLRTCFFLTIGLSIYLFQFGYKDYCFILVFLLVCGSILPVTGLKLAENSLKVRQYYVYGLIPRTWTFNFDDSIEIMPFDLEVSDAGYLNTDEWWDVFTVLLPTSKTIIEKFIIKHTDIIGNQTQVKMKLTSMELEMIQNVFSRTDNAHNIRLLQ